MCENIFLHYYIELLFVQSSLKIIFECHDLLRYESPNNCEYVCNAELLMEAKEIAAMMTSENSNFIIPYC